MSSVRALRQATLTETEVERIRAKLLREHVAPGGRSWKTPSALAAAGFLLVVLLAWWLPQLSRPTPPPNDEQTSHLWVRLVREDGTTASLEIRYRPEVQTSGQKERR